MVAGGMDRIQSVNGVLKGKAVQDEAKGVKALKTTQVTTAKEQKAVEYLQEAFRDCDEEEKREEEMTRKKEANKKKKRPEHQAGKQRTKKRRKLVKACDVVEKLDADESAPEKTIENGTDATHISHWSGEQDQALRKAVAVINPALPNFWKAVAAKVDGKSEEECAQRHMEGLPSPVDNGKANRRKSRSQKTAAESDKLKERARQLRLKKRGGVKLSHAAVRRHAHDFQVCISVLCMQDLHCLLKS